MKWHIDAWDALGGRAFASQRERNADLAEHIDSWGPTVYIGPPSFSPEQIANIGIALSASRSGLFDPRVPLDQDVPELEFPNADAVAEFVRRAFIGGGRTRGGEGGFPVVEGRPQGPPEGEGGESMIEYFLAQWMTGVDQLERNTDMSAYFLGDAVRSLVVTPSHVERSIVDDGALQILATMLAGFPISAPSAEAELWQTAAATLNDALVELLIWRSWLQQEEPHQYAHQYLDYQISGLVGNIVSRKDAVLAARQLLCWPVSDAGGSINVKEKLQYGIHYSSRYGPYLPEMFPSAQHMKVADKYEALFTWPLPYYARVDSSTRTVGQLLVTFVSEPGAFMRGTPGALDIVAFAAAFLASHTEDRSVAGWREQAAATWLAGSVPRWVFRAEAEALIREPTQHVYALQGNL